MKKIQKISASVEVLYPQQIQNSPDLHEFPLDFLRQLKINIFIVNFFLMLHKLPHLGDSCCIRHIASRSARPMGSTELKREKKNEAVYSANSYSVIVELYDVVLVSRQRSNVEL